MRGKRSQKSARAGSPSLRRSLVSQAPNMPLDPRAKRFLDRLAALNPPSVLALTVSERRTGLQQLLSFSGPGEPIGSISERSIPGPSGLPLTLRVYRPAAGRPAEAADTPWPALIYFHGGGLVAGSLDTHDP